MIAKSKYFNFIGYIEGYYGKILSWNDRYRIIDKLSANKMTAYLYAPKEDPFHRFEWRKPYPQNNKKLFIEFTKNAKQKNVEVIVGIAPGLDFTFKKSIGKKWDINSSDLKILEKKCHQIISFGVNNIALMFDDIEPSKVFNVETKNNEGKLHAKIANHLNEVFKINFFIVPRVYSNELVSTNKFYLKRFFETLNNNINIFFCGENIVAKSINNLSLKKFKKYINKIIIWDNFYANDYCPKKIFLGPLVKRTIRSNIMINATGMIETDLFLLDIFDIFLKKRNSYQNWKKILQQHKIPSNFVLISGLLKNPFVNMKNTKYDYNDIIAYISVIDCLLWKWKSPLSREWYPFLFNLKCDILLENNLVSVERILKTETVPLGRYLTQKLNVNFHEK